jgi:hypothetical protein
MQTEQKQFPYRDDPLIVEALVHHARLRGRTCSEELRLAVRLWLCESELAALSTEEGRREIASQGHDLAEYEQAVRDEIEEMRGWFAVPDRPNFREVVVSNGNRLH